MKTVPILCVCMVVCNGCGPVDTNFVLGLNATILTTQNGVDTTYRITYRDFGHAEGSDSEWGTADDDVLAYAKTSSNANTEATTFYNSSGPDGRWFSDDDHAYLVRKSYTVDKLHVLFMSSDISYSLGASLGEYGLYNVVWKNGNTRIEHGGRWLALPIEHANNAFNPLIDYEFSPTEIFDMSSRRLDEVAVSASLNRTIQYSSGDDFQWMTGDDMVVGYTDKEMNEQGQVIRSRYYNDPGADEAWFTSDDPYKDETAYSYEAGVIASELRVSYQANAEENPSTLTSALRYVYNTQITVPYIDKLEKVYLVAPGDDRIYGTDDDASAPYVEGELVQKADGSVMKMRDYTDPGRANDAYVEEYMRIDENTERVTRRYAGAGNVYFLETQDSIPTELDITEPSLHGTYMEHYYITK